jgi:hypothetical protein
MITAEEKIVLLERYLLELQERIEIRYQGCHEDKRVGYGYEVVKSDIQQVLKGTYYFSDDLSNDY